jgi:hypothetical protein
MKKEKTMERPANFFRFERKPKMNHWIHEYIETGKSTIMSSSIYKSYNEFLCCENINYTFTIFDKKEDSGLYIMFTAKNPNTIDSRYRNSNEVEFCYQIAYTEDEVKEIKAFVKTLECGSKELYDFLDLVLFVSFIVASGDGFNIKDPFHFECLNPYAIYRSWPAKSEVFHESLSLFYDNFPA